ncbi:prepilin-type N-terminal cleavage/methylation domain-containing protein [Thermocrinis sp.]
MRRAFTLIEVLLVLTLLGLLFGTLSYALKSGMESSLLVVRDSQRLKDESLLVWNIQRKVLSAKDAHMEENKLFLHTYAGDYYEGMVKCAYIYKDGELYYYEFPYPYGSLNFYEEERLIRLGRFKSFSFSASAQGTSHKNYKGLPELYRIVIEDREYIIKP